MKDNPPRDRPGEEEPHNRVLGSIPKGDLPTSSGLDVEQGSKVEQGSDSTPTPKIPRGSAPAPSERPGGPYREPEVAGEDKLRLPRRGLVAMRKSGGLRFTSREVIVYRDGTVVTRDLTTAAPGGGEATRRLDDGEFAALYRVLESAELPRGGSKPGRQNPDAYTYEVAARLGRGTRSIEVSDGSIPRSVAPLIETLSGLMQSGPT